MKKDLEHERLYKRRPPGGSTDEWEVWDRVTSKQVGDLFAVPDGWEWHYILDGQIVCGGVEVQQYQAMNKIRALLEG